MKINEHTGLYENYGLWHVPFWQTQEFYFGVKIIIGVLFSIILIFCVRAYMRRKKNILAWDNALLQLHVVYQNQEIQNYNPKEFYLSATSIIKHYLYNRFEYDVIGKTDEEVIRYLEEQTFDPLVLSEVAVVFRNGVAIKFANVDVAKEQIKNDYDRCLSFINVTIPSKKQ